MTIEEALEIVEAFINGRYKSIYLMDAFMTIKDYINERSKDAEG